MKEFKIRQKWEDMMGYAYIALRHIPKSERFTLGSEIRNCLITGLKDIIKANIARNKLPIIYSIDINIKILFSLIRVAADMQILPFKKYEILSEKLTEIGKMVGGWIKSCR
jgi:hypothetical protein